MSITLPTEETNEVLVALRLATQLAPLLHKLAPSEQREVLSVLAAPPLHIPHDANDAFKLPILPDKRPSVFRIHAALIMGQILFGGGSVVGKLGVEAFNPLIFALIREVNCRVGF